VADVVRAAGATNMSAAFSKLSGLDARQAEKAQ
jgi:hypothetical protein